MKILLPTVQFYRLLYMHDNPLFPASEYIKMWGLDTVIKALLTDYGSTPNDNISAIWLLNNQMHIEAQHMGIVLDNGLLYDCLADIDDTLAELMPPVPLTHPTRVVDHGRFLLISEQVGANNAL